ncbi:RND transporter [Actinoalloteichus sp. AHMU CJ021]|uniref:Drug exporter of the RND superfamily n=1 Tax=Actinoalloteichus caeruleus DSM 43889 TaxID=1120930 RepID=A0ABT1JFC5_ACTCY|nr:MMPL family transporter [Actinoalloteichus caeruleus]AUS77035.1 RND transporter [Actinoalloteichus sp. AHMU CJ021]MCP2330841.1 putative drug exporter of the RND superfamily [Actinoalloteichus caeruleus DSM 43889]
MANLLYRLGRLSARRAWAVIATWILALAVAAGAFLTLGGSLATNFSIPGTETERVNDSLTEQFPELTGATASVVFATDGEFGESERERIDELLNDLTEVDGVTAVTNPFETEAERDAAEGQVTGGQAMIEGARSELESSSDELEAGQAQLDAAIEQARAAGAYEQAAEEFERQQAELDAGREQLEQGLREIEAQEAELEHGAALMEFASTVRTVSEDGGTAIATIAFEETMFELPDSVKAEVVDVLSAAEIDGVRIDWSSTITTSTEGIMGPGEVIGVIVAGLVLLIMMRAFLPAITPLISSLVGVGVGVAGSLAFSGLVPMASITPVLGVMLGLAVGIDYSLFILNRHRKQLLAGMDVDESIGLANGTAGNAVVFAGSTVIVALVALGVTGIPFLATMGVVGAACVLVAVLVSISLTPALLGLLGTRALGRKARETIGDQRHTDTEVRPLRTPRALGAVALATLGLLVLAVPALSMRLGLPEGSSEAPDTTQYQAFKTIESEFGAGVNGPLIVVAELPGGVDENEVTATQAGVASELMEHADVSAVAPIVVSDERDVFLFQVLPVEGPSSESTENLVRDLRGMAPLSGEATLGVAGQASGNIDVSEKLADALPIYLVVVVGLSLLIMIVVFRSLLVPLIATAGYVLSLFAALGAVTAIYQWGWLSDVFGVHEPGPVLSFGPIIIMGVLFGLAMDYQLFLVSGMREAHVHGMPARAAVVQGLRQGRAVVTAAAIIMISVFGGFVFSELGMVRPLGFGLAIGVLFDAFVVRMVLVPALMHLLGEKAWYLPKWLDRIMPDVDVEGASLERAHSPNGSAATS